MLDIGLPGLNGIEAAKQIRRDAPNSKILFVSQHRSREIAEKALETGAGGYVIKSASRNDLLPAVDAILRGTRFVSSGLTEDGLGSPSNGSNHNGSGESDNPTTRRR